MQKIVKERLPKFTPDQIALVKGSIDYIGINQYTASYIKNSLVKNRAPISYSTDWHVYFFSKLHVHCHIIVFLKIYVFVHDKIAANQFNFFLAGLEKCLFFSVVMMDLNLWFDNYPQDKKNLLYKITSIIKDAVVLIYVLI